jgi:hypothetical protein
LSKINLHGISLKLLKKLIKLFFQIMLCPTAIRVLGNALFGKFFMAYFKFGFFKETLFVLIEFLEFTFSFRVTFAVTWRGFAVAVRWEELFFLRKKSDLFLN